MSLVSRYVGELGYELFVPAEQAVHVYDTLRAACGEELTHVGLKALGSLRMEKGYRDYGHDLDNTDTLLEAGLAFTADTSKPGGFCGMDRLLGQRAAGGPGALHKRIVSVLCLDPAPLMFHGEVLLADGVPVGDIRAASYGHTLGGAVGLGHIHRSDKGGIDKAWLDGRKWEVDVAGVKYPAKLSLAPLYDPKNLKIKC